MQAPCTNATILKSVFDGESLILSSNKTLNECGSEWYFVDSQYYGVADYFELCGSNDNYNSWNIFGCGLVSEGDSTQNNYVWNLSGDSGWILLIFAGIDNTTQAPDQSWIDSLNWIYDNTKLNVVIRLSPPWGQEYYRDESDDSNHLDYTTLSQCYANVVSQLPMPTNNGNINNNLYFQIDNEPDLCSEWWCSGNSKLNGSITYQEMAKEYAYFYSYVADKLHGCV